MLQIVYNSTPLWDYFIDNCNKGGNTRFVKLQRRGSFWSSPNFILRVLNLCIGRFIRLEHRYVIKGDLSNISDNDVVIFLGIYNFADLMHFREMYKYQHLILWLWNPVTKTYRRNTFHIINKLKSKGFDIFTFDPNDAKKYRLHLRPQFTMLPIGCKIDEGKYKSDVYFLGQPKGREQMLEELKRIYLSLGIQCDFKIVYSPSDYISYEDNIRNVISSKCVLEICQEGQHGLTLRALEAMLCHRKLITNNKSIVKEDFYNPQNIFIIGVDDNQNVKDFIDSDFVVGDESILKKYDFNNWLNSFIEN